MQGREGRLGGNRKKEKERYKKGKEKKKTIEIQDAGEVSEAGRVKGKGRKRKVYCNGLSSVGCADRCGGL